MSAPAVFLERETVRLSPPAPERWTWRRIFVVIVVMWALSGIFLVPPDQEAVESIFGKVVAPCVTPGLHYALPWPVETVAKLKVRQLRRVVIGGDATDLELGRAAGSQFLTGDQNVIQMRVVVQFSVATPVDYLFQMQDPATIVSAAVEAELAKQAGHRDVDSILT